MKMPGKEVVFVKYRRPFVFGNPVCESAVQADKRSLSDGVLGPDTDNVHLHILLLQVILVARDDKHHAKEGKQDVEHMAHFAAHLPRVDLSRVRLRVQVVNTAVKPVTVAVNVELLEISEFVQGMVLQVVGHDLVLLSGLGLVGEAICGHDAR